MKYLHGEDRSQTQLFPVTLENAIEQNNEVRLIDLYVDSLHLQDYGFKTNHVENGRPAYHPSDLLKLYIYGYLNKIRSSRDLEKACKRNIEVMWLLRCLKPDHNTIANFRKDNPKSIKRVFHATVKMASHFDLIGGQLLAGDSTKLRAQNSKKNNFNEKKITWHLQYIETKLGEYNQALAEADGDRQDLEQQISKQQQRKENYQGLREQLQQSEETQISTSDPESRHMISGNNISEVVYNTQTTVDSKHSIPIDYKVTNANDLYAMGNMLRRAKTILGSNSFTALYDKGYHTGSEFKIAHDMDIEVMVAIPDLRGIKQAPDPVYNTEDFTYNTKDDIYTCPQGKTLTSNGKLYKENRYLFKRYTTRACKNCMARRHCTKVKTGRTIKRNIYAEYIAKNKQIIEQQKDVYKKRQCIVEHPFGKIKRQGGFNYILTKKGKSRASADVGFMFTAYVLRRIINIIGRERLQQYLKELVLVIQVICSHISCRFGHINTFGFEYNVIPNFIGNTIIKHAFIKCLIKN